MARTPIPLVVLDSTVSPPTLVAGATVAVVDLADSSTATVYQDYTGLAERSQPLSTDTSGRVNGYLDRGSYKFTITIPSRAPYIEYWDSSPGSDGAVDEAWLANNSVSALKLKDGAVTATKFGTGAVTTAVLADDAVTAIKIAPGAVGNSEIAANSVATGQIQDDAVTVDKLANASIPPTTSSHGFSLGGVIIVPVNNTTDINVSPGWTVRVLGPSEVIKLVAVDYLIHGGTSAKFTIYRNNIAISSWTSLTATPTRGTNVLGSPITLANGDYIQLRPEAPLVGTPSGLAVTVHALHYPLG